VQYSHSNSTWPSLAESAAEAEDNFPTSAHKFPSAAGYKLPSAAEHDPPSTAAGDCADIQYTFQAAADLPSMAHPVELAVTQALALEAVSQCVVSPSTAAEPPLASPSPAAVSPRFPSSAAYSRFLFDPWIHHNPHRNPGPRALHTDDYRSSTPDRGHTSPQLLQSPLSAGAALRDSYVHLFMQVSNHTCSFHGKRGSLASNLLRAFRVSFDFLLCQDS